MIKYFRFTSDQVLWEISWANLMLYSATIPSYEAPDKDKDEPVKKIEDADVTGFFGF